MLQALLYLVQTAQIVWLLISELVSALDRSQIEGNVIVEVQQLNTSSSYLLDNHLIVRVEFLIQD